jgi:hypothetical protein
MLNLQADIINVEAKVLGVAVWACETNKLPETARALRLTIDILRESARIIKLETEEIA